MNKMMRILVAVALSVAIAGWVGGSPAWAKGKANIQKLQSAMMSACEKEYPEAVKGKKISEVAEWVDTEENGTDAATFKKSKCYAAHEKWEVASGKKEAGEKHSAK